MFINCSKCYERHTTHHQELKNCNCSLWFYIRLWLRAADRGRQPQTYVKPEAAITVFELLMMSGVSLETCRAIKKHWNNKFYYKVELLMMSGVSLETCRAIKKHWNNKFYYTVELLVMSGVSLETCRTIKKHWNNKFYYTVELLMISGVSLETCRAIKKHCECSENYTDRTNSHCLNKKQKHPNKSKTPHCQFVFLNYVPYY